jgi:hypothetical protein
VDSTSKMSPQNSSNTTWTPNSMTSNSKIKSPLNST